MNSERILVIEDELPMRTALQDVLEAEGYRVLTAADGESGLRRAITEKPDIVLLDIMMPKLDGFEVCAELRRLANPVPVLMLTAKGQVEDRVTGLDAEQVSTALAASGYNWSQRAAEVRQGRFGGGLPKDPREKARQLRFLQFRGFSGADCARALRCDLPGDD